MKKQINYLIILIFSTMVLSSCEKNNVELTEAGDVFSGTTWLFTGHDGNPHPIDSNIMLVFDSVCNVQMGERTVPYSVDSNVITLFHPGATSRSHRFILSEDERSVKFLDNFNFTLQSLIWDTTYFERVYECFTF
jgi:hypothetical protein